jgi:tetratricopeptide (TPR) repeat protein
MSTIVRTIFQLFLIPLLLISWTTSAWSTEPLHVYVRRARKNSMDATLEAQSKLEKGDFEGARRAADAVIKADPTFYVAYLIRAEAFMKQRKYLEAAQDCNEALRMDRTFGEAALLRARANYYLGHYAESLKEIDHVASLPLRPDANARAYSERAWFRLNCPDRSYRDAHQAIKDAATACRLIGWRDEDMIDLLATAYAETGDFDAAVRYEQKALAIKGVKSDDAKRLQRHLDSFKQHKTL